MTLSWDLFIIAFFVFLTGMGAMLGRGRVLSILVGSYIGYVVATEVGALAFETANRFAHTGNISLLLVKAALLFGTIVVLNAKTELGGKGGDDSSIVVNVIYGILTAGFITTAVLSFLETSEKASLLANSNLLTRIDSMTLFWVVAPVVFLIFADFLKSKMPG